MIWANLLRKKTRTIFTLLSVIVAFLLFGLLQDVDYAFDESERGRRPARQAHHDQQVLVHVCCCRSSCTQQIEAVPGVAVVTWLTWFGAYYQESKNFVFALPIDTASYFDLHKGSSCVAR